MIRVSVEQISIQGSVGVALGTDIDTEHSVIFGGDWRPLTEISEALANGEDVIVEVEPWQILSTNTVAVK